MNAKVERTKRAFQEAFCRLIQTTPAAQITVSELCREAGLNRSTFYRHYAIPLDVITDAVREILAQGRSASAADDAGRRCMTFCCGPAPCGIRTRRCSASACTAAAI